MKKFLIKVNGTDYEVEVEEIGGSQPVVQTVKPAVTAKVEAPKAAAPVAAGKAGAVKVTSPMPGTILGVKVKQGDTVKKGDTIIILEAMKMENEIPAPQDGVISSINVETGASVESGQLLASLN
ncbi:MAG: biotin/lipoyl-binding protein [Clostridia bacterium]|nr:biotin/lipoyl-binding protein [Clostridia bacterium]